MKTRKTMGKRKKKMKRVMMRTMKVRWHGD